MLPFRFTFTKWTGFRILDKKKSLNTFTCDCYVGFDATLYYTIRPSISKNVSARFGNCSFETWVESFVQMDLIFIILLNQFVFAHKLQILYINLRNRKSQCNEGNCTCIQLKLLGHKYYKTIDWTYKTEIIWWNKHGIDFHKFFTRPTIVLFESRVLQ